MVDSKGWIRDHVWATGGFLRFMLPWLWDDLEQTDKMFGGDAWPYGLEPNRHTLEVLMDYMVEQGLMPQQTPLEELFVAIQPEA
jgi:4,5-dihydroxyphthalate decarboxylase